MYRETSHDLDIKYSNTIVGYKRGNEVLPFSVVGAGGSGDNLVLNGRLLSDKQWKDFSCRISSRNLILTYPRLGNMNLSTTYIYIERTSKKQYRKTLAKNTLRMYDPFYEERRLLGLPRIRDIHNKGIYIKLFNPKFPSIEEALDSVVSKDKLSSAFSPEWGFGLKARSSSVLLFKNEMAVGEIVKNNKVRLNKSVGFLYEQIEELNLQVI